MTSLKKMAWTPVKKHSDLERTGQTNGSEGASLSVDLDSGLETQCGIGSWKPEFMQVFSNMISFSVHYGIVGLVTTALTLYLNSQVTTLEKLFGLSSAELGMLLIMNDIGYLACVILVGHFFRYYHKPRVLAVCTLIYGISAIVSAMPHFVTQSTDIAAQSNSSANDFYPSALSSRDKFEGESLCRHQKTNAGQNLTQAGHAGNECTPSDMKGHNSAKTIALLLISTGMFFQGFAKAPRQSMVQTYIDDNVVKTKTGFFMGLIACVGIFGPVIAFTTGAAVSRIYVTLEDRDLSVRDPRWIGAWWLGFIIFGLAALVVAIPLLFFPKRMAIKTGSSDEEREEVERRREIASGENFRFADRLKDMPKAILRLLTNCTYVCILTATVLEFFPLAGRLAFTPKYMEVHFGLSTFKSNMLMGTTSLIAASIGMLVGGIVTTRLKLQLTGCVKLVVFVRGISVLIEAVSLFLACPQPYIEGFQAYRYDTVLAPQPMAMELSSCSTGCSCLENAYFPVCGSDGVNYFNPCVAGCSSKMGKEYNHCACVSNMTVGNVTAFRARPGKCIRECDLLTPYIIVSVLSSFLATVSAIPLSVAVLRSVWERDKGTAVGLSSFVVSLLAWTIGPVLYGRIIDSTCQIWHTSCAKRGACAIYDIGDFRWKFHGVGSGCRLIGMLFLVVCLLRLLRASKGEDENRGSNHQTQTCTAEESNMLARTDNSDEAEVVEPVKMSSL